MKGYSYLAMGKTDLALKHFFKAISLPPKDDWWFAYHTSIGSVYARELNDIIKALPYLKKGVEKEESQYVPIAYVWLAGTYGSIGDYEKAEQYFRKSLDSEVLLRFT